MASTFLSSPAAVVRRVLGELLAAPAVDPAAIAACVDPGYRQRVDGRELGYEAFVAHLRKQKEVVAAMRVEFLAIAEQGEIVFTNHLVHVDKRDGSRARFHVIAQFAVRGGRLVYCDELTRMVEGGAGDADLGARH